MKKKETSCSLPPLYIRGHEIATPIIQGGMGVGISLGKLATAVAKQGGVGTIAAVLCGLNEEGFFKDPTGVSLKALAKYIRMSKEESKGVIAVNIMVAADAYAQYVQTSVEAGVDIIISGAGLPMLLPELVPEDSSVAIVPIVSSGKAARIICTRWEKKFGRYPDAIVVEGPKAGGHLGFKEEQIFKAAFSLEAILLDVLCVVREFEKEHRAGRPIPVIAAGGIYSGGDIFRTMQHGVAGVQMGTRFVATHECDASNAFKQAYVDATEEDVRIIKSPVGLPGRALHNDFLQKVSDGEKVPKRCITNCLKGCKFPDVPYCISLALINAQRGNLGSGFAFCGENVSKVTNVVSVAELMSELTEQYVFACAHETV